MVLLGSTFLALGRRHARKVMPKLVLPPEAHAEIWGKVRTKVAWKDSFSGKKTLRHWKPNVFDVNLYSEILEEKLSLKVSTSALRAMDFAGGIDNYLMKTHNNVLGTRKAIELKKYLIAFKEKKEEGLLSMEEIKKSLEPEPRPWKHGYVPKHKPNRFYFDWRGPRRQIVYC